MLQEERLKQIEYVINNSKYVNINQEKLDEWCNSLKCNLTYEHHLKKYKNIFDEKEMILLVFLLESINFCFWKEPIFVYKDKVRSSAMFQLFIEYVINNRKMLDINYLNNFSYNDFINIFGIEEGNLKKRYESFMYTVNKIFNNNDFYNDLFKIKSVDDLYSFITDFDNFNDVSPYKGKEIYFYKRATLLVNDLFELSDTINNNIKNIDTVLGCADYIIPSGLHFLGIFRYSNKLESFINNGIEIKHNSEYEVEIRAYTLWVIEYVKNKIGNGMNSARVDNIIWNSVHSNCKTFHKTDTIFY